MKTKYSFNALALCAVILTAGCGDNTPKPPANAMRPPDHPVVPPAKKDWSKQDKIDAVQKSGMSEAQKKDTIAKINSGAM